MEGDPDESDEDLQGSTVLWEKHIQQSIFVDLSEDESLHFSDLESSLALHLSQEESAASEASIHISGSAELSALDDTSSESSSVTSQSERVVDSKTKSSSIVHVSAQRPNTMQEESPLKQGYEDPGQNTSDEDQEDLPYDGDLGSPYFNNTASSEGNMSSDGGKTVHASPHDPFQLELSTAYRGDTVECLVSVEHNAKERATMSKEDVNTKQERFFNASEPSEVAQSCQSPADINQLLLRHFSREELLQPGRMIEAETLPEVSLLESMDDTVLSWALAHNSTTVKNNRPENPACYSEMKQSFFSDRTDDSASKNSSLEKEAERKTDDVTSAAAVASKNARTDSNQSSRDNSAIDALKQEKSEEDDQVQRGPLVRTRSFSEMKYGQGQVHYRLPDFSKVAPKVKIPKAPSGPTRPVPQSHGTMHRAQSSPGMLEVISRVLEDSLQPPEKPYVFKDEEKQTPPALVHHLQAEYDKLLTKYAEAENLIDQMRLGTNTQPSSAELMLYSECDDNHQRNLVAESHLGSLVPHCPPSENSQSNIKEVDTASSSQSEEGLSDGEKMTAELRDIISPFMQKVEEFKVNVSNMLVSTAEQQMMLRSMMDAQDQLERKYISKKEEHRALEMQNYMGLSRNTGTFDPNRLMEGDIFRIGMLLEDIKEMTDRNMCEQISPPHSSSTPTPVAEMLHVKASLLCTSTPSPPFLHESPCAGDTWENMETLKVEEEEVVEASDAHRDGGLEQSSELVTTDSVLRNTGYTHCHSRSSWGSAERRDTETAEDGEGNEERSSVLSEGIDHSNILAYLSGTSSTSRTGEWTTESRSTPDNILNQGGECDLGDCVSLAVEVSSSADAPKGSDTRSHSKLPVNTPCASQRIVSPETDSGFGSSYLDQSAAGLFQPNLLPESVQSQNEILSSSDSEGSCSNLQTAIHSASQNGQRWASPHTSVHTQPCGAAAAVERWVESTTKEPSVRLQGSEYSLPTQPRHHVSEAVLSTTMDTEERGSQVYSCSCNSEAILALQSEVFRLKKDLQEGLVQLPHLAQRMDYLTSKYGPDRQERRSKTRPRTHLRSACNSPARIEDWISSDMDPSKRKGPDSSDTEGSEIMLQFHNSPAGDRRGSRSMCSGPEFQFKTQSNRAAVMERFYCKERSSPLSSPSLQKPLLQVNYRSSSSLPASYKVREPPLQSMSHHRKRSTQSDTALLPSNVYFQRTPSPVSGHSRTVSRATRRGGSKEEEMNRMLDQAIEVARSMKRTTDRMTKRLTADLAKAQLHRKLHNIKPLGGSKYHTL